VGLSLHYWWFGWDMVGLSLHYWLFGWVWWGCLFIIGCLDGYGGAVSSLLVVWMGYGGAVSSLLIVWM